MYSRYILLSTLLVIGAETYAKNSKTEVVSLSSSYNNTALNLLQYPGKCHFGECFVSFSCFCVPFLELFQ